MSSNCPWNNFLPATMKFCEENLCSWIRQPFNTWTNLSYILLGIIVFYLIIKHRSYKGLSIIPLSSILVGITSFLYHLSGTFFFQVFDLSSMFLFSSVIITLNLIRANIKLKHYFLIIFLSIFIFSFLLLMFIRGKSGVFIFGSTIVVGLVIEFWLYRRKIEQITYRYLILTLIIFLIAFLFWILDFFNIWCNPNNHYFQGHGIWHIINSLCFLTVYFHYKQDNIQNRLK